jgi:hypothetical protein
MISPANASTFDHIPRHVALTLVTSPPNKKNLDHAG